MPIYRIELSTEVIVNAASLEDAIDYASMNARHVVGDAEMEVGFTAEVDCLQHLPPGWDGECFPYGEQMGDNRLKDLLPPNA